MCVPRIQTAGVVSLMEATVMQGAASLPGDERKPLTVSEWAPFWRNELGARGVRPATVVCRLKALRRLTQFYDGTPENITAELLVQWRESMRSETVDWRGSTCDGLKRSTVNGYLGDVATF